MADDINWTALETLGSWAGLAAAGVLALARWISGQKKKILSEVADLRESHEDHVANMRSAHAQNHDRLIRLEEHQSTTERELRQLRNLMESLDVKQDKQMELLITISTTHQGRR